MRIPLRKIKNRVLPCALLLFLIYFLVWKFLLVRSSRSSPREETKTTPERVGPGENGLPVMGVSKGAAYSANGFNGDVSDRISLRRSLPDIRHPLCRNKTYSSSLPTVSFVIPFHNEHWTTLLRTFITVIDRSPPQLLTEIILVDDASTKEHLKKKLDDYLTDNALTRLVKVVRLKERSGLIGARLSGAKIARAEVLFFLDSHTEPNINFLPPILDPITLNYRTVVCPFIDVIDHDTFAYRAQDEGARGAFDWYLFYKRLPLLPEDLKRPTEPFLNPIMAGGLFAISAKFFWELGGYDDGLQIWGGEQYELSFKIWMCGGKMVDAPCSRIGHIYRAFVPFSSGGKSDYLTRNHKRVAEVWMDEYKQYIYDKSPHYKHVNPGDLSKQHELRKRLKCKSFKWFIENVAFDLVDVYPPVEPPDYVKGAIKNSIYKDICVGSSWDPQEFKLKVGDCSDKYFLSYKKDFRLKENSKMCWDVSVGGDRAPVHFYSCHGQKGNQYWKYEPKSQKIIHGVYPRCLDVDINTKEIFVSKCTDSLTQKWSPEEVDLELLKSY